jgi:hypothetical protein
MDCRCSGKVEMATPSDTIRAKTDSRIGITVGGSFSSSPVETAGLVVAEAGNRDLRWG